MIMSSRRIGGVALFLLSLLFLAYYLFLRQLPGGIHFGGYLAGFLGLVFLAGGLLCLRKKELPLPQWLRNILHVGVMLFGIWFLSFLLMVAVLFSPWNFEALEEPDYLVVLGAGLNGTRPSLALQTRLETALAYLQQHPDLLVVVTGGQGPGESVSEAEAMGAYLIHQGLAQERLLYEARSTSTMENFSYTRALLASPGRETGVRINLVTSDFHLLRARLLAQRNGFLAGTLSAPTPGYLLPANLLREYFALVKSLIFDR